MFNERTWKDGEKLAAEYMRKHGYKIMYTNYFCVKVELDIVAILPRKTQLKRLKLEYRVNIKNTKVLSNKKTLKINYNNLKKNIHDLLIVCEVKARSSAEFGKGYDAVDSFKQKNMIRGANYLLSTKEFENMQVRFDVASIDNDKITYIENAFTC